MDLSRNQYGGIGVEVLQKDCLSRQFFETPRKLEEKRRNSKAGRIPVSAERFPSPPHSTFCTTPRISHHQQKSRGIHHQPILLQKHSIRPSCRRSLPLAPSAASQSADSQLQPQNVLPASPSTTAPPPAAAFSPSTTPALRDPPARPPVRQLATPVMLLQT